MAILLWSIEARVLQMANYRHFIDIYNVFFSRFVFISLSQINKFFGLCIVQMFKIIDQCLPSLLY